MVTCGTAVVGVFSSLVSILLLSHVEEHQHRPSKANSVRILRTHTVTSSTAVAFVLFFSLESRLASVCPPSLSSLFSHRGTSPGRPRSGTSSSPWPTGLPGKRPAPPSRTCRWPGASSAPRQGTPGTAPCGTCIKKKGGRP